jgi:hypothetical protein
MPYSSISVFFIWNWEMYPAWNVELQTTELITLASFPIKDLNYVINKINDKR